MPAAVTRKLFWDDPYRTRLDTRIAVAEGADVRLEETIFYAFSGGQESDTGAIGGRAVLSARKDGHDIVYTLGPAHGLAAGDPVTIEIDWARRFRLMRLHFAAELVLELAYRRLGRVEKIGAHIAEGKSRIDFRLDRSIGPDLPALQAEAEALIAADHPILSRFSDEEAQRRTWEIEAFAKVACGGTHLRSTGEVGPIRLKRDNIGKGKERVEIYLAD
jgi:Ser-tRNA(Ala) deacylase AlaX